MDIVYHVLRTVKDALVWDLTSVLLASMVSTRRTEKAWKASVLLVIQHALHVLEPLRLSASLVQKAARKAAQMRPDLAYVIMDPGTTLRSNVLIRALPLPQLTLPVYVRPQMKWRCSLTFSSKLH